MRVEFIFDSRPHLQHSARPYVVVSLLTCLSSMWERVLYSFFFFVLASIFQHISMSSLTFFFSLKYLITWCMLMSDITHMRVVSGTLDMMPSRFDMWHVGGIWHFGHALMLLTFMSLLIRTRCFVRALHYPCPRVVSIVLMHSLIFHIVHVHTFFGVCCCQIHLMCWWFLAHRTWCHVFLTCYMWVAFDPSDMISCYWHVYRLWSGQEVLYRLFNYQCPHVVSIVLLHSVIFHIVHVHHDPVYAVVRHTSRVGGSGHIGHDIMFPWHVTCWWHLAHRTWSHVIDMCIICVSFYDIMFCAVQCFSTLVQPFITHSVISNTYVLVVSGT